MNLSEPRHTEPPTVTFHGAAQSVSGSMHLLESGPYRFLLDCGLFRGPREEARNRNSSFPFDPASIDAVFLSHAHVDHCGNLPNLFRQGFSGPVYCTPATRDLIAVMLADSARAQQKDIGTGLYGYEDVDATIDACVAIEVDSIHDVNEDVQIRFIHAGHILGSAILLVTMCLGDREYRVTFSGDLGRRGLPYLCDPSALPPADLIICESTYGGKTHDTVTTMSTKMSDLVHRTIARGGKVLIPAFSLGRTHLVLHYMRLWMADGLLPQVPIYVDSPLAQKIDDVCQEHGHNIAAVVEEIPFDWIDTAEDAWEITTHPEPCIIIASGGMCEGGRIVQHLRQHVDDPRSTIVLVSYQAPGSLGAQLLQRVPTVRFHGQTWNKWIGIAEVNGFSGHADKDDFEALLSGAAQETGRVRLVHGEPKQMRAMVNQLRDMGFADVAAPRHNETVSL